jgi:hypothetical protein
MPIVPNTSVTAWGGGTATLQYEPFELLSGDVHPARAWQLQELQPAALVAFAAPPVHTGARPTCLTRTQRTTSGLPVHPCARPSESSKLHWQQQQLLPHPHCCSLGTACCTDVSPAMKLLWMLMLQHQPHCWGGVTHCLKLLKFLMLWSNCMRTCTLPESGSRMSYRLQHQPVWLLHSIAIHAQEPTLLASIRAHLASTASSPPSICAQACQRRPSPCCYAQGLLVYEPFGG